MTNDYPTEEQLERIRTWTGSSRDLLAFIKPLWWLGYGWTETEQADGTRYTMSTGGWSGNESIIDALNDAMGRIFWICYWESSRRGGHFEFFIPTGLR